MDQLTHKHLLISAYVKQPPTCELELTEWMRELIQKIDMNILHGPISHYSNKKGNRGISSIAMIDTSHVSVHIWDEVDPALLQMDVYSCKDFNEQDVIEHLEEFTVDKISVTVLDREY